MNEIKAKCPWCQEDIILSVRANTETYSMCERCNNSVSTNISIKPISAYNLDRVQKILETLKIGTKVVTGRGKGKTLGDPFRIRGMERWVVTVGYEDGFKSKHPLSEIEIEEEKDNE